MASRMKLKERICWPIWNTRSDSWLTFKRLGDRLRSDSRRLFAVHVLPRPQRRDRHFDVQVAWSVDEYGVDVFAVQQFPVVGEGCRIVAGGNARRRIQTSRVFIAQGYNLTPGC